MRVVSTAVSMPPYDTIAVGKRGETKPLTNHYRGGNDAIVFPQGFDEEDFEGRIYT
jgi:hypothetical protein